MPTAVRVSKRAVPSVESPGTQPSNERHIRQTAAREGLIQTCAGQHVRSMRGGSQAQLLWCTDDHLYVVKFPNNPRGLKTLACDLLGTLLAREMGLPTQIPAVVSVPQELIRRSPALKIALPRGNTPCVAGKSFGSRYPCAAECNGIPLAAVAIDFWPNCNASVRNLLDCAGIAVFDQWTCNTDVRQFLFWRGIKNRNWRLSMIDQGSCFNGHHWNFPKSPLWGLYHGLVEYLSPERFDVFEPWLDRLERDIDLKAIYAAASKIPPEWYKFDTRALERLVERLDRRRLATRELMWTMVRSVENGLSIAQPRYKTFFSSWFEGLRIMHKPDEA